MSDLDLLMLQLELTRCQDLLDKVFDYLMVTKMTSQNKYILTDIFNILTEENNYVSSKDEHKNYGF